MIGSFVISYDSEGYVCTFVENICALIGTGLNLKISFGNIADFVILIQPICQHRSLHSFIVFFLYFLSILKFYFRRHLPPCLCFS